MNFKSFFLGLRRFSNMNVLHKGLLLQDWVFRLGLASNKILTFTVGNNFISVLFLHDLFVAKLRCAWNYEKTAEDFLLLLHLLYQFTREEVKEDRRTFMSELRL